MFKSSKLLAFILINLICVNICYSTTIYVPADQPTIQVAIYAASNGDTILVSPGTYVENLNYLAKVLYIISTDGPLVTILESKISELETILMIAGSGGVGLFEGFTVTGADGRRTISTSGYSAIILNNIFHGNNPLSYAGAPVIGGGGDSVVIARNQFYNNGGEVCVSVSGALYGSKIINNSFDFNRGGIQVVGDVVIVRNNIITNSLGVAIYLQNPEDTAVFQYNNVWNNGQNYSPNGSSLVNNISNDPLYLNAPSNDYHLTALSPCIDAGDPDVQYNDSDGSRNDMGAFAFAPENYPIASKIEMGAIEIFQVPTTTPTISWNYFDTAVSSQGSYKIEVSTDQDWAIAEMWSTGEVFTSDTEVVYSGISLEHGHTYYLRIAVSDGASFGDWAYTAFVVKLSNTFIVPIEQPSIKVAIDVAVDGDTIMVMPGTYFENLSFHGKNLVLTSLEGAKSTIIEPLIPNLYALVMSSGEDSTAIISGFTITGSQDYAILVKNSGPTIENNIFHSNNSHVIFCDSASANISRNLFYNNLNGWCIVLYDGSQNTRIINNTFDGNLKAIQSRAGGATALNNIITNSIEGAIDVIAVGDFSVLNYNNIWNNHPNFYDSEIIEENISSDPFYRSPVTFDYSLQNGSPCLDSGDPDPIYNDQDGTRNDMGAYSFVGEHQYFPVALQIQNTPSTNNYTVTSLTPTFYWQYYDTTISSQAKYEIQIGTNNDWGVAEMWNSGEVNSTDTMAVYSGTPLEYNNNYFLRMKVSDGTAFGAWQYSSFRSIVAHTIIVPTHQPTIQEAINVVFDGDTVEVLAGTYVEHLDFIGKSIVLISRDGPELTTLMPSNWYRTLIELNSNEDSTTKISGFTFTGLGGGGITLDGSSPTIENNIFSDNQLRNVSSAIIACTNSNALITRNLFYGNIVGRCVSLGSSASGVRIVNNTFDRNKVGIFSDAGGGVAINNIITNSLSTGVISSSIDGFAVLDYNNVWNNGTNYENPADSGVNSISVDPQYWNAESGFYYLSDGSPCIDVGDPDPNYNDQDGSRNDMGISAYFDCCNLRGDLNYSGSVAIEDLTYLVNFFFKGGPSPICDKEADLNASGAIDVADLTYLVNFMFKSGPAPASCN